MIVIIGALVRCLLLLLEVRLVSLRAHVRAVRGLRAGVAAVSTASQPVSQRVARAAYMYLPLRCRVGLLLLFRQPEPFLVLEVLRVKPLCVGRVAAPTGQMQQSPQRERP